MQYKDKIPVAPFLVATFLFSGCGGGSGSSPEEEAALVNTPAVESDSESAAPQGGFCADVTVAFQNNGPDIERELPGLSSRLVQSNTTTDLSGYSQINLADRSEAFQNSDVIIKGAGFTGIHGNLINTDQVDLAFPAVFSHQWTAENNIYQPEGVSSGDRGLYGTHVFPFPESDTDYVMFSLDPGSGQRRWVVQPGQVGQGGTPLVLNNPRAGKKIVYSGGLEGIFAVDEAGELLWCTNTGREFEGGYPANTEVHANSRLWGLNYHLETDSLIAVFGNGEILALDRDTGKRVASYQIEGAPSVDNTGLDLPGPLLNAAERAMRAQFLPPDAELPEDERIFDAVVSVVLGGGVIVSNYFATDPNSDRLWVAATMPDEFDGNLDGAAEFGALYSISLSRDSDGLDFNVNCRVPFAGGSASTPTVSPGGDRVYTSDNEGNALAFDDNCELIWSVDVGDQILGSLALSQYDNQLYASTGAGVFQIIDRGTFGELGWTANIDEAFSGGNLITSTVGLIANALRSLGLAPPAEPRVSNIEISSIGENAIVLMAGLGFQLDPERSEVSAPLALSTVTIDRQTGEFINGTPAREESIAVISVGNDGSILIGNSPLRRVAVVGLKELLGGFEEDFLIPPLSGGVSKYAVSERAQQTARDALCYASRKLSVWTLNSNSVSYTWPDSPESIGFSSLMKQGDTYLRMARERGELTFERFASISSELLEANQLIADRSFDHADSTMKNACSLVSEL